MASEAAGEKRVALVIGNSGYATAPLTNPANDARAVASKLQQLGFEVVTQIDASQRELTRALSDFSTRITPGAVALFYYAGHGIQVRGKNFLVPVDAEIKTENTVSSESVDVERVFDQLSNARLSMVILDACRNNPFESRFRSGPSGGLAQIDAPTGSLIAYSTAPGRVALDGTGKHAPYTEALLEALDTPGLRVEDVFKEVRIKVLRVTNNQQTPWESSSLTGDFVFRPDAASGPLAVERLRAQRESDALRSQLAAMNEEVARLRKAQAQAAAKGDGTLNEGGGGVLRDQIALLTTEMSRLRQSLPQGPAPPAYVEEWKKQIESLQPARQKLTFVSAMQQLLGITAPDDLTRLQAFVHAIERRTHTSALAVGVAPQGTIVWGGASAWDSVEEASGMAVDFCMQHKAQGCKVVLVNGTFARDEWFAAMAGLGMAPPDVVRRAFTATLRQRMDESTFRAPRMGRFSGAHPVGFTFAAEAVSAR